MSGAGVLVGAVTGAVDGFLSPREMALTPGALERDHFTLTAKASLLLALTLTLALSRSLLRSTGFISLMFRLLQCGVCHGALAVEAVSTGEAVKEGIMGPTHAGPLGVSLH